MEVGASTECLKLETAVSSLYFAFVHAKCDRALAGDSAQLKGELWTLSS